MYVLCLLYSFSFSHFWVLVSNFSIFTWKEKAFASQNNQKNGFQLYKIRYRGTCGCSLLFLLSTLLYCVQSSNCLNADTASTSNIIFHMFYNPIFITVHRSPRFGLQSACNCYIFELVWFPFVCWHYPFLVSPIFPYIMCVTSEWWDKWRNKESYRLCVCVCSESDEHLCQLLK